MLQKLLLILGSAFLLAMSFAPAMVTAANACDGLPSAEQTKCNACDGAGGTYSGGTCSDGGRTLPDVIKSVTNVLTFLIGAVSVLMLIIGGLRYVLSGGDSAGVEGAKNTIIYAVVGIIVAAAAYAIVNFVISNIK